MLDIFEDGIYTSFTTIYRRWSEFDAGSNINFKASGRNIKGTTLARRLIKTTARHSFM